MVLVLKIFIDEVQPSEIDMSTVDMWVRVYDLPPKMIQLGNLLKWIVGWGIRLLCSFF